MFYNTELLLPSVYSLWFCNISLQRFWRNWLRDTLACGESALTLSQTTRETRQERLDRRVKRKCKSQNRFYRCSLIS